MKLIVNSKGKNSKRLKTSSKFITSQDSNKTTFRRKRKSVENIGSLISQQIYEIKSRGSIKKQQKPHLEKIHNFASLNFMEQNPIDVTEENLIRSNERLLKDSRLSYPNIHVLPKERVIINIYHFNENYNSAKKVSPNIMSFLE